MKIAYNNNFGGWGYCDDGVIEEWCKESNTPYIDPDEIRRTDPLLIRLIEKHLSKYPEPYRFDMAIAEIPDDATDYLIIDCDGLETVYYVHDGKIHRATGT